MILLFFFTSFFTFAQNSQIERGLYACREGNNESVCDQRVLPIMDQGKLAALSVTYAGYCNGQGPYRYPCIGEICTDGVIKISLISATEYHWINQPHKIECLMEKI